MTALVGYYLSEVAPAPLRKDVLTVEDVKKFFKQANFRLPKRPQMALVNAKNAGYLDPTGESGSYRLNPVGYNLIAHSLPAGGANSKPKRTRKKTAKAKTKRRR